MQQTFAVFQEITKNVVRNDYQFGRTNISRRKIMLRWVIALLVIALLAAILGFGGVAGAAAGIAKIVFVIFLALAVLSFIFGRTRGI
jgi:uncharacterized membrane protein YtjA (UPF0391 family)